MTGEARELDPGWERLEDRLVREFRFTTFTDAFALATRIALLAQARNHHPELRVSWGRLVVILTTHEAGDAVSERDLDLARRIDRLIQSDAGPG
jgi:4a-hydroxytetrahydrobiopterin dehydratase